jgi:hypothetical protein
MLPNHPCASVDKDGAAYRARPVDACDADRYGHAQEYEVPGPR